MVYVCGQKDAELQTICVERPTVCLSVGLSVCQPEEPLLHSARVKRGCQLFLPEENLGEQISGSRGIILRLLSQRFHDPWSSERPSRRDFLRGLRWQEPIDQRLEVKPRTQRRAARRALLSSAVRPLHTHRHSEGLQPARQSQTTPGRPGVRWTHGGLRGPAHLAEIGWQTHAPVNSFCLSFFFYPPPKKKNK